MTRAALMLAGFCAVISYTSCKSTEEQHEEEMKYVVTTPIKMDTSITKDYVAQVHSIRHIELRAREKGYLQRIFVEEGQFVKKGQLLFQIMPSLYEAELQKAQAEADFAEIEYQNTKKLADSDVVSPNELAMAKAKFDKAKADVALTKVHLQFTEIRAPFDGIIDRFHVREGSFLDEGELLTALSDNSKMWVYYNVPEVEYLNYQLKADQGRPASVNLLLANHQLFTHPGMISTIEADFNHETGNIPFRATFPNPNGLLRHGQTGNIRMDIPIEDAIIIPQKATFEVLEKKYVFVVDENDIVRTREITIGEDMEDLFVVSDGLAENEKILLEGIRKVRDGDQIAYTLEAPEQVISNLKLYAE